MAENHGEFRHIIGQKKTLLHENLKTVHLASYIHILKLSQRIDELQ